MAWQDYAGVSFSIYGLRFEGWRHLHWNALETAYNHTPFFEYYKDDFQPFYEREEV